MVHLGLGWTVLPVIQAETGPTPLTPALPEPIASRRLVLARRATRVDDPAADALEAALIAAGEAPMAD